MKKGLLIIDVQNGMFQEGNVVDKGERLLKNISKLIVKARSAGAPILYVQHNEPTGRTLENGTKDWEIHPEITPNKEDIIIQKTTPDSFFNTLLDEELRKQGIDHLVITGIQTEVCVDTTCRRAFSMKYKVTLPSDTHSTWDTENISAEQIVTHHNRVLRWFADVYPSNDITF
ncbi:cysteine hydrolase family protein [Evansella cellulosilytica]|uniref:Isochorismatase hydrolase n=1 Tax=Evansella cellulosilytica (strain ATCC 21833 / DSM 2522 / FERM P-1141 / JCM 9156 / N-4) TaxID=649639 RepID=E6U1G3_EVAC2|nr:cysteine hydrolase family protein [Evansella cellulosilytica]ADU29210.1 isochorismatase hydrolase [Evansella cellulosilytica DSM 2522]